jgi:hypothetical protein
MYYEDTRGLAQVSVSPTQRQVATVAAMFSTVLREWLTAEQMTVVVERNTEYENVTHGICASHDFCDANMAMAEAFHRLGLKTNIDHDGWDQYAQCYCERPTCDHTMPADTAAIESASQLWQLWADAWDLAKSSGFSTAVTQ